MSREVCLQCGSVGFANAQVYCVKCLGFFVHRYCLDVIPETVDEFVHWVCDICNEKRNANSLGKHEAPCQASTEDLANAKDINSSVNSVTECIKLGKRHAKDNQLQVANLQDESFLLEKVEGKRRLICSTKEKDVKSPVTECNNLEFMKHAKSASESTLPKEAKEKESFKHRDQRCSSERPCESNAEPCITNRAISRNGSFKSAKEDVIVSSSDMTYEAKSFRARNELNVKTDSIAVVPYDRSIGEAFGKDSLALELDPCACAEPQVQPVWRGSFEIWNRNKPAVDGLMAHLSSKACRKVEDEASMFETVLRLEMVPRADALPKCFREKPPNSEHIALYFFPSKRSCRFWKLCSMKPSQNLIFFYASERVFHNLVDEMMTKELAMKGTMLNAELLLFPSTELPMVYWRFQGEYFIWGVFRAKQLSTSQSRSPIKVQMDNKP